MHSQQIITPMAKYKYGDITFGSFLAREHWVIEGNIMSLKWCLRNPKTFPAPELDHLNAMLKSLKASERRIKKQLIKDGYFIT